MKQRTAKETPSIFVGEYRPFRRDTSGGSERLSEAQTVAKAIGEMLKDRFHAKKVYLFGSVARDEMTLRSDIDLAESGIAPSLYYRAVAHSMALSGSWKVDLVDLEDCSESLRRVILEEGVEL